MTRSLVSRWALGLSALSYLSGCGDGASTGDAQGGSAAGGSATSAGTDSGGNSASNAGKNGGGQPSSGGQATTAGSATGGSGTGGGGVAIESCTTAPSAAPEAKWVNATGNLAKMASECGNLGLVSAQPCSNRVIAGVAQKGLWETVDGGKTWTSLGQAAGSDKITNRISAIVYDPKDPKTFWESGIYNGGGVYKTTDSGQTFKQLGDVTHCDSVSVDLSDPDRKTLLAGSHETNTKLNLSLDSGKTWMNVANGLPTGQCTATLVIDPMTLLIGCNSGSIARSENAGAQWATVPGSMGGGTFQPLVASDGTIYWPGSAGGIYKSDDAGKSFSTAATTDQAPGIVSPAELAELPDGRIVIIGKDHLLASGDKGKTWTPIGDALPYAGGGYDGARGVAYSVLTKTFFIWRWDCMTVVPDNAIMSMGFDWEAK